MRALGIQFLPLRPPKLPSLSPRQILTSVHSYRPSWDLHLHLHPHNSVHNEKDHVMPSSTEP